MSRCIVKFISTILTFTVIATQAFALCPSLALGQSLNSSGTVAAPTIFSDICPDRTSRDQGEAAHRMGPGAIGNGQALIDLVLHRTLPRKELLSGARADDLNRKLRQAVELAIIQYEAGIDRIRDDKFRGIAKQAVDRLRALNRLKKPLAQIYPFYAIRDGEKNYLVGFPMDLFQREEKAALAVDFIDWLYNMKYRGDSKTALRRLVQYVGHEFTPENTYVADDEKTIFRQEHTDAYVKIQRPIFGDDEVKALGEDLRAFINEPHGIAAPGPHPTAQRGIIAGRVAVVGDSQRARLAITEIVNSKIPVVAWACGAPAVERVPFLIGSSTHGAFGIDDLTMIGNPESGDIAIKTSRQKEPMRQLVFDTGRGAKSASAKTIVGMLSGIGVDTVILEKEGMLDEAELAKHGIHVVVMDKEHKPQDPAIAIPSLQSEGAFRIGRALSQFAISRFAEIQFGQMKIIEPNETTLPANHRTGGSGQLHVSQTELCQKEFREGLGIPKGREGLVPKTLRFGYPVRQGLIMTAVVVINKEIQAYEVKKSFEELAEKDGFFVVPEDNELLNTERMAGEQGLYLYGEPLVQTTEDGRSLVQISFIADPIQTQVEELVQVLHGREPRVPKVIRRYRSLSKDVEPSADEQRLKEDRKSDLAEGEVSKLIERFNRKWAVEETKKALRDDRREADTTALRVLFDRINYDFTSVEFLTDSTGARVGIIGFSKDGEVFATTLLSALEPEGVAALQQKYYQTLRERIFSKDGKSGANHILVRDVYQPADRLSAVWGVEEGQYFTLLKILGSKDRVISQPLTKYPRCQPDQLGVFVNGAGGRIGSEVTRIIAGDAIDLSGKVPTLSGRLIPVGMGVSGFEKDGRRISGAEAFARLVKDGDPSTGPFSGEVHHGYENGKNEDWVELTPKNRQAVRIAVFSDRIYRNPENYPLVSFLFAGVPIAAVEATGVFTDLFGMNKYLWGGAERANLTAPGSSKEEHWQTHTFVYGRNSGDFNPFQKQTASASCTTTCASALNDMLERIGANLVAGAMMPSHLLKEYRNPFTSVAVTYHSYTGETLGADGSYDEDEKTQGRVVASGGAYLAPTGFAKAGKIVIPEINANGDAIRGPWPTASVLAQVIDVPGHWSIDDIKRVIEAVKNEPGNAFRLVSGLDSSHQMQRLFGGLASMQAVVDGGSIQIVHIEDNWGRPRSVITLPAWYENEWGFSTGVARFLDDVVRPSRAAMPEENKLEKFPERLSAIPEEGSVLYSDRNFLDGISDSELERELEGKIVFVRADYNVVSPELKEIEGGKFEFRPEIVEDFRILKTVRDLQRLRKVGARIVLASHNGRYQDVLKNRKGYSLEPVAGRLSELLDTKVKFSNRAVGIETKFLVRELKKGEVLLLENLRANPGEENGSLGYAEELAETINPDAYVFLAFGAAHRGKHASIGPLIDVLRRNKPGIPVIAGELVHEELKGLKEFLNDEKAKDSSVAILGGAKPADKIEVMRKMILGHRVKKIAVVGAMSVYFYMAKGLKVGNTFLENNAEDVEKSVQAAFEILRLSQAEGVDILLPADYRGLDHSVDKNRPPIGLNQKDTRVITMEGDGLPAGFYAYSVGSKTVSRIADMVKGASWVILNGTAGMVEVDAFRGENDKILEAIDKEVNKDGPTRALLLGGDGVAAFSGWARDTYGDDYLGKISPNYTISTGGGASLELFSRLTLSGLDPLDIKVEKVDRGGGKARIAIYGNLKWRLRTPEGIREHLRKVVSETRTIKGIENVEIVLFVPSDLADDKELFEIVKGSAIKLGVQNIKLSGESTNELTAEEARRIGYTHVLIGHSDRRGGKLTADWKPETNGTINARLRASLKGGLTPLFLFGETLEARLDEIADQGRRWQFIDRQLKEGLAGVSPEDAVNIRFAIEPAWAIGKQAASSLYANVQLEHTRKVLAELFGSSVADKLILGYGAGANERNIISYISRPEIDFVVPGRPAAEPRSFTQMINQAVNFSRQHRQRANVGIADEDGLAQYYNDEGHAREYADLWDQNVQKEIAQNRDRFLQLLPKTEGDILDAGTGSGRDTEFFITQGMRCIGIDKYEAMLEEAKKRHPKGTFVRMDMASLGFGNDKMAGIWSNASLIHLKPEDASKALEEFFRVLVNDGVLYLRVKRGTGEITDGKGRYTKLYQKQEIEDLVKLYGFEIIESVVREDSGTLTQAKRDIEWIDLFAKKSKGVQLDDEFISKVRSLTGQMAGPISKNAVDPSRYVVIMKKNLPMAFTGAKSATLNEQLAGQYQRMKQRLGGLFTNGFEEVETEDELINLASVSIGRGLKVIILDDGTLTGGLKPQDIAGKPGEDYCAVTTDAAKDLGPLEVPFVNLNAMAMMGVGRLYIDSDRGELFKAAYRAFTGREVPPDIMDSVTRKAAWIINVLPRLIRLSDEIADKPLLSRLIDAAA